MGPGSAHHQHWRLTAVLLSAVVLIHTASAQSGNSCGPKLSCLNGGVCNVTPGSDSGQGYLCACPNGFAGDECATACGGAGEPTCEAVSEGATQASATTPTPTAANPTVDTANPAVNSDPATGNACGPHLVCQNGGVCNQTPGSEAGQGYLCACLNGFVALDCSVASSASTSANTATQGSQATPVVLTPSAVTASSPKKSGGGAKVGVIIGCIIAALAALGLLVGGIAFVITRRRRATGGGALAYQEREKAHAQMSSFDGRNQESV